MDANDKQQIADALDETLDLLSGDEVVAVSPEGDEYPLTVMIEDWVTGDGSEGLDIDSAGLRDQATRKLTIRKAVLTAAGIILTPAWHWLLDGERWDFVEAVMISDRNVPIAGIHNQIVCIIRKAVELNSSKTVTEFTYGT